MWKLTKMRQHPSHRLPDFFSLFVLFYVHYNEWSQWVTHVTPGLWVLDDRQRRYFKHLRQGLKDKACMNCQCLSMTKWSARPAQLEGGACARPLATQKDQTPLSLSKHHRCDSLSLPWRCGHQCCPRSMKRRRMFCWPGHLRTLMHWINMTRRQREVHKPPMLPPRCQASVFSSSRTSVRPAIKLEPACLGFAFDLPSFVKCLVKWYKGVYACCLWAVHSSTSFS